MSDRCYHVDRRGHLAAGEQLRADHVPGATAEERALVAGLFGDGVGTHGRHYCELDLHGGDADDLWDLGCELLFELVRRERFPERPSRFRAAFGFESLAAVERFAERFVDGRATVFEVRADTRFRADMELVDAADVPGGVRRAHYYWEGTTDSEDPLWELLLTPPVTVERRVTEV